MGHDQTKLGQKTVIVLFQHIVRRYADVICYQRCLGWRNAVFSQCGKHQTKHRNRVVLGNAEVSGKIAHEGCPSATLKTYVDIERSFPQSLKVNDAGFICPRLTANDILYVSETLPVYTYMVPEGDTPAISRYGHVANCICTAHTPSDSPHIYQPPELPPVDPTDQPNESEGTEDTDTPVDSGTDSDVSDSGTDEGGTPSDGEGGSGEGGTPPDAEASE